MKKTLVKRNRKIIGFTWQNPDGSFWYAFGRPSQVSYIAFECNSIEQGMARIEMHSNWGNM
jgi:hypothetical protein